MNKQTFKRYAISSGLTFATTFALVLVTDIDMITLESFKDGTVVGLIFVAVRAGIKSLLEFFINTQK